MKINVNLINSLGLRGCFVLIFLFYENYFNPVG
jgi:hypothetical protein